MELAEERINMLNTIGFNWTSLTATLQESESIEQEKV